MIKKKFIPVLLVYCFSSMVLHAQWIQQNSYSFKNEILTSSFVNKTTGWGAGNSGTILKTTNFGNDWIEQNIDTSYHIKSIKFVNLNTGFIACDNGKILKTTDSGNSWTELTSGTVNHLKTIFFIDEYTGWAGGIFEVLKTTNSGVNWIKQQSPLDSNGVVFSIFFIDNNTGWIAGFFPGAVVLKTTNGGTNWNYQSSVSGYYCKSIQFLNSLTGYLITDNHRLFKSSNGGYNWNQIYLGTPIYSMSFINSEIGYVAGYNLYKTDNGGLNWLTIFPEDSESIPNNINFTDAENGFLFINKGKMFRTSNGGISWGNISKTIGSDLQSIKFLNSQTGLACGNEGTIIKTENGGDNWNRISIDNIDKFRAIQFVNNSTGYILSRYKKILKTIDTGNTWTMIDVNSTHNFNNFYFLNENTGWICGDTGTILKTTNAGLNWISQNSNTTLSLGNIYSISNERIITTGYTSGVGIVLLSTNSGNSWLNVTPENDIYWGINFINENTGYIGGWKIYKTTNAGNNWIQISSNGSYFIKYFNENKAYSITGAPIFKKTMDGGINWQVYQFPQSLYISGFLAMDFIDENTGWIAGFSGDIYKTTNGGTVNISQNFTNVPDNYSLSQNYPNPFNPATKISFDLPKDGLVKLMIYDITGRLISTLVNEMKTAGSYNITFDGSNFSSGVYFYRLEAQDFMQTRRMVLIK